MNQSSHYPAISNWRDAPKWLCALALVILVQACQTNHQLYGGAPRSRNDVAILQSSGGPLDDFVRVEEIDGKSGPNKWGGGLPPVYNSKWNGKYVIELEPGVHTATVNYNFQPTRATAAFEAKPGKIYTIKLHKSGQDLTAEVEEVLP